MTLPFSTRLRARCLDGAYALRQRVHRHHRALGATVAVLLAGFGVTAFGIAPLAPDAADLPRQQITLAVDHHLDSLQLDALEAATLLLPRSDVTRADDSVDSLLRRLGVNDDAAAAWLRRDVGTRPLWQGGGGKMVTATTDQNGLLMQLVARLPLAAPLTQPDAPPSAFQRLRITRDATQADHWQTELETVPFTTTTRLASGTIDSSLFAATDAAGLPDGVAMQLVEAFSNEIDFHRQLRKGDRFTLVYESLYADGEPVTWGGGGGRLLAAEFVNAGKPYTAFWFGEGKGGYFDADGQAKRRAFLASPLAVSRMTSGFAMRVHPISGKWRAHKGVDYGAPTGTSVRVVGDGVVELAGRQSGYGNVVQVRHAGGKATLYAHLSRIDVRAGQRVEQGQRVGAVGATGWATGPHLHFEYKIGGVQTNPVKLAKLAETTTLSAQQLTRFEGTVTGLRGPLTAAAQVAGAPGRRFE